MKPAFSYSKSDWIGIMGSLACLMHCVALPAVFYFLQLTWGFDNHWYDYSFAIIALGAVGYSIRKMSSSLLKALLLVSLLLFATGLLLEHTYSFSTTLLHIGSIGLITGHALNLRTHYKRQTRPTRSSVRADQSSTTAPTPVPRLHRQPASLL